MCQKLGKDLEAWHDFLDVKIQFWSELLKTCTVPIGVSSRSWLASHFTRTGLIIIVSTSCFLEPSKWIWLNIMVFVWIFFFFLSVQFTATCVCSWVFCFWYAFIFLPTFVLLCLRTCLGVRTEAFACMFLCCAFGSNVKPTFLRGFPLHRSCDTDTRSHIHSRIHEINELTYA